MFDFALEAIAETYELAIEISDSFFHFRFGRLEEPNLLHR